MLKDVLSRYSDNSGTDSVNVCEAIFQDIKISSMTELGKDKLK